MRSALSGLSFKSHVYCRAHVLNILRLQMQQMLYNAGLETSSLVGHTKRTPCESVFCPFVFIHSVYTGCTSYFELSFKKSRAL